jgi:predicted CXXCH cytochrome family protein
MRCLIRNVTRKRSGISHDDHPFDGDHLTVGRAASHPIFLSDLRVALNHARISHTPDGKFQIVAQALSGIRLNGETTDMGHISVGDEIALGACRINVVEPPEGYLLCLEVEQPRAGQESSETLQSRSTIGLENTKLSKRGLAWAFFVSILAVFLLAPVSGFLVEDLRSPLRATGVLSDKSWDTGRVANVHQFIGDDCNVCHQKAFVQVEDTACVACHSETPSHADPVTHPVEQLTDSRCGTCHKEHNAPNSLTRLNDALCVDCHSDIQTFDAATELLNASDFERDHPEFKATLFKSDGSGESVRVSLANNANLKETSGLIFNHEVHLAEKGITGKGGKPEVLTCDSCHALEPGGAGLSPVTMAANCQRCHTLGFDPGAPEREVPHGTYQEVISVLEDYYAKVALKGGYEGGSWALDDGRARPAGDAKNPKPAVPDVITMRRRPGEDLSGGERTAALAWANQQWQHVAEETFKYRTCNYCHIVTEDGDSANPSYVVAPVKVADQWFPKSVFAHVKHRTMECVDCHDAKTSKVSEDVLLPGINSCYECHGGPHETGKLASQCVDCHKFHIFKGAFMGHPSMEKK